MGLSDLGSGTDVIGLFLRTVGKDLTADVSQAIKVFVVQGTS